MGACASRGRSRSGSNPVHELDRGEDQSIDDASSIKTTAGGSEDANVYEDSAAQGVVRSKPLSELEQYEADLTERDLTLREKEVDLLEFDEDLVQRDQRIKQLENEFAEKLKALRKLERQIRRREARVVEREERLFAIPVAEVVEFEQHSSALVMT